jgi:SAM-dependent methyltransferase
MQHEQQQRYYELGRTYWWLAGKYRVLQDVLQRSLTPSSARRRVLDLGCGPGNLLDVLGEHGDAYGSDYSSDALRFCVGRGYRRLFRADFHDLPLRADAFDLVTCCDVLEHVSDDRRALAELLRVLKPGGLLVATVPAFQFLWGDHDTLYGHLRRYRAPALRERLLQAGFDVQRVTYFEPAYVAPLWLFRKLKKLFARGDGLAQRDDFVPLARPLNALLSSLLGAERFPLRLVNFPFGVTLLALARKPARAAAGNAGARGTV